MSASPHPPRSLYVLPSLTKGFAILYFLLLPVFYSDHIIGSAQIGYIGALFIGCLILGAAVVVRWLYRVETRAMLVATTSMSIAAATLLFAGSTQTNLALIVAAYCMMGAVSGVAVSGFTVLSANYTTRGDRFIALAKLGTFGDVLRIVLPLLIAGAVALWSRTGAAILVIAISVIYFCLSLTLPKTTLKPHAADLLPPGKLRGNKAFKFVMGVEFADSFSSSQLFVFLPLLFLTKGHSLGSSLLMQSFTFLGYMGGRWLVAYLAKRTSGLRSIGYAEFGMVASIVLLLVINQLWLLYVVSFVLGIFVRGTAPTIKGVVLDTLQDDQIKRGSAVYTVVGDGGSALGQLAFGLLVAWQGPTSPFVVAACVGALTAFACLRWASRYEVRRA